MPNVEFTARQMNLEQTLSLFPAVASHTKRPALRLQCNLMLALCCVTHITLLAQVEPDSPDAGGDAA